MNELQVVVKQEVGKINWNFEELKTALATEMKKYTGIVFDDDSIADAKKTVAYLRKLKESVEDRRKDVKKKCLEPYNEMEKQAKELTQLIDEPINTIAKQVKDYEEEQKKKKKEEILAYMAEVFAELPETVASKLKSKIYDSKWENKSTTKKTWQDAVNTAFENTKGDLNILDGIEEDFREDAKKVYERNLVLSEALSKVQELRKQKEMILERERQKREREEAAKREALAKKEEQPQEPEKAPEQEVPQEPPKKPKKTEYSTDFQRFWRIYPRKDGKGEAYKKYKARLNDGWSPDELCEAAENYKKKLVRERTESKYIKHAKTFLSENTPFEDFLNKRENNRVEESQEDEGNPFR